MSARSRTPKPLLKPLVIVFVNTTCCIVVLFGNYINNNINNNVHSPCFAAFATTQVDVRTNISVSAVLYEEDVK